jgi:type 1 glutamine amidotransferase
MGIRKPSRTSRVRAFAGAVVALSLTSAGVALEACAKDLDINPVADAAVVGAETGGDAAGSDGAVDAGYTCAPDSTRTTPKRPLRILQFTKETLYFHAAAHEAGDVALPQYLRGRGHEVTVSADPAVFTDTGLAHYDVILFFVSSGNFLNDEQRLAFQRFVHAGKGVAGVHTASATELDSPFFRDLIGATFRGHGIGDAGITPARVVRNAPTSPLVSFLPEPWERSDEWYYYAVNPAKNAALTPLLSLDESSIAKYYPDYPEAGFYGAEGHPLSWTQRFQCARVFYTALGHTGESYGEELFLRSIALGTEWAGIPASESP